MATTAAITSPLLTAGTNLSAAVSPLPKEPQDRTLITDHPSNTSHPEKLETLELTPRSPALFINSIAELKDLSSAIASFQRCYEDLHNHLDSIKAAMLSKMPLETPQITPVIPSASKLVQSEAGQKPDVLKASPEADVSEASPKPDVSGGTVLQKQQEQNPLYSELEDLCKTMCSRGIRKYLQTHLSNLSQMREEVPKALKLAPDASKLVLESLGKFYLQGSKAFTRNSPMIPAREASIFILECFLLMMGMDTDANGKDNGVLSIEKAVKVEADKAALAWRKRLIVEGGLAKANEIDARGLLLFVACFGIPDSFKRDDIRDLALGANAKEIAGVLRKSHVLMSKIPEIVEWLVNHNMEVDAVNLVYTFGLEERFNPQNMLVSYLKEFKESSKKPRKGSHGSAVSPNESNKKQLAALKSIRRCLERHKVDPAKLLPGWQINEKITTLEKDITDVDRKSGERKSNKRKAKEAETSFKKPKTHDPKRSRHSNIIHGPQHQRTPINHSDSRRNLSNSGVANHRYPNNYPASTPVVYGGPGAGLLPESMVLSDSSLSTVPYPRQVTNHGDGNLYAWHRESGVNERYAGQSSSLGGIGLTSLYRGSTSMEGFAGVPNGSSIGVGSRGSDLYQFADSVVESESYPRSLGGVPSAVPTHYMYQG